MGNRKLAATISGYNHSTSKSCYSSEGISAHLRSCDDGIKVEMKIAEDGVTPIFRVYRTGGSNNSSTKGLPIWAYDPREGLEG